MVLVIDDDETVRGLIAAVLSRNGMSLDLVGSRAQAISKLRRNSYRAVLLDLMLRRSDGLEILRYLKREKPDMLRRVVLVTTAPEDALRRLSEHDQVWGVVRKPFDIDHLVAVVRACQEQPGEPVN